ncbi:MULTISPECIES: hypothetical protein [Sphingobacterium]|uniref:hypothetical protein n=1 Tax=Sphingobacterium TaxID=28453 RepID=UPI0028A92330|nr:hypothetical protein [Sphingobacterium multivorum]
MRHELNTAIMGWEPPNISTSVDSKPTDLNTHDTAYIELIARIIGLIRVDEIYYNQHFVKMDSQGELVVLVPKTIGNSLAEYIPLLDMVFRDYPDLSYRLFNSQRAKEEAQRRNIFYYLACHKEKHLYSNPIFGFRMASYLIPVDADFCAKAKAYFDREMAKVRSFRDGVSLYHRDGNHPLVAFMLHQQLELTYRTVEIFMMGRDKVTHSINVHQRHIAPYFPQLGNVFNQRDEIAQRLVMQLDDAYLAVRYGHHYAIKKEKLATAIEKAEMAYQLALTMYSEIEKKLFCITGNNIPTKEEIRIYDSNLNPKGETQAVSADIIGMTQQIVSKMEKKKKISDKQIAKVAEILNTVVEAIKEMDNEGLIQNNPLSEHADSINQKKNPTEKIMELYERLIETKTSETDVFNEELDQVISVAVKEAISIIGEKERIKTEAKILSEKLKASIKMIECGLATSSIADMLGLPIEQTEKLE